MDGLDDTIARLLASDGQEIGVLRADAVAAGRPPPTIVIGPTPEALSVALQTRLLRWWEGLDRPAGLPLASEIAPERLREMLGRIAVVEPVDDGRDFYFRLYGSVTASFVGADMTGKLVSESPSAGVWDEAVARYHMAVYRTALRARKPVYTLQIWNVELTPFHWHRLVLPFADATGAVSRLMLLTVPCDECGRPLAPFEAKPA